MEKKYGDYDEVVSKFENLWKDYSYVSKKLDEVNRTLNHIRDEIKMMKFSNAIQAIRLNHLEDSLKESK